MQLKVCYSLKSRKLKKSSMWLIFFYAIYKAKSSNAKLIQGNGTMSVHLCLKTATMCVIWCYSWSGIGTYLHEVIAKTGCLLVDETRRYKFSTQRGPERVSSVSIPTSASFPSPSPPGPRHIWFSGLICNSNVRSNLQSPWTFARPALNRYHRQEIDY